MIKWSIERPSWETKEAPTREVLEGTRHAVWESTDGGRIAAHHHGVEHKLRHWLTTHGYDPSKTAGRRGRGGLGWKDDFNEFIGAEAGRSTRSLPRCGILMRGGAWVCPLPHRLIPLGGDGSQSYVIISSAPTDTIKRTMSSESSIRPSGLTWIVKSGDPPSWNRVPADEYLRRTEVTKLDGVGSGMSGSSLHEGDDIEARVLKEVENSLEEGSGRYIRSVDQVSMSLTNADQVYRAEHFDLDRLDKPSEFLGLPAHFRDSIEFSGTRELLWVHRKVEDEYGDIDWDGKIFVLNDDGRERWNGWELTPRAYARSKLKMLFRQVIDRPVSARVEPGGEKEALVEFEDLPSGQVQGTLRTWFSLISALEQEVRGGVASYRIPVEALDVSKGILQEHGVTLKGL